MTLAKLREEITNTALCYSFPINAAVVTMHLDALKSFPYDDCIKAYARYRMDHKSVRMPVPGQILAILKPNIDHIDIGILAAAKIVHSVSKFGHTNPDLALAYIGHLGWQAVQVFGGWQYVCENLGSTIDVTTFQAQVREIARAESKVVAAGAQHLSLASNQVEKIEITKKMSELLALCKPKEF